MTTPEPAHLTLGIDVSHHQGKIDFTKVAQAGYQFAYVKLTQGQTGKDATRAEYFAGAKAAKLLVGGYHFFNPAREGEPQAEAFAAELAAVGGGDLPPMVDLEPDPAHPYIGPAAELQARVLAFLVAVEKKTGQRPIVYTFPAYAKQYALGEHLGAYDLFIANVDVKVPTLPAGWASWRFWQYSWKGKVPGVENEVDLDFFRGSREDLLNWARASRRG